MHREIGLIDRRARAGNLLGNRVHRVGRSDHMHPSMSHLFVSPCRNRIVQLLAITFTLLTASACVPYVKYEDAMSKLGRANQVNSDLERTLRDVQVGSGTARGELMAANATIESLQIQNATLKRERSALEEQVNELMARLSELPPLPAFDDIPRELNVNQNTGGIMLPNTMLFPSGKFTLRREAKAVLDQLVGLIQRDYPDQWIFVDGHTDNVPITKSSKVNKDNWDLGSKRAHAVFAYLKEKGIAKERMVITSRGSAEPVEGADQNSKEGRATCRRVEIRIKPIAY